MVRNARKMQRFPVKYVNTDLLLYRTWTGNAVLHSHPPKVHSEPRKTGLRYHLSHWNASCGGHECQYHSWWRSIQQLPRQVTQNHGWQPCGGTRGSIHVKDSKNPAIHPVFVWIFQSGPKWWTDQQTNNPDWTAEWQVQEGSDSLLTSSTWCFHLAIIPVYQLQAGL